MGLSRLDNFLNSPRGTVFYVDANALDATDSIENKGTSLTRPFKTIQRALAEVARFSYQRGLNNDRFSKSTILISPGTYFVDNRPGATVKDDGSLVLRNGASTSINQWDLTSNFDLDFDDNALYKLNSVYGGLIVPRGCSIIGSDLRKVKIVPLYVPDPYNNNIDRSAIFRLTGACFLYGFTVLDSDPNGNCYKDYTRNKFVPNFSHHKLTAFEYADGVNNVELNDSSQASPIVTTRTDLDMFYDKIARVYGNSSGRNVPDATYDNEIAIDLQPVVDEYRIVGSRGKEVGITSAFSGDGVLSPLNVVTLTLNEPIKELNVDSPIQVSGISSTTYNGQFVVSNVISSTSIQYRVQTVPTVKEPSSLTGRLNLVVDTVTSASPYVFNVSLRSVYGMCGLHADGNKSDGFKSMVVAQFTGIGLQKDDNAFVIYNKDLGVYRDSTTVNNLHTNSRARFKPEFENYHIKASNNSFLQLVSIFAIGYANHFVTESGADFSVTNSNSNFGAKSLVSSGFRKDAFSRDDVGYITHIIPPQEIESQEINVEFISIDVGLTTSRSSGAATTSRLYLYNETNLNDPPKNVFDGYRIGAKPNEILKVQLNEVGITSEYSSNIVIPGSTLSDEKSFNVQKTINGNNQINSSIITFTENHTFETGESVRIISNNGHLPDKLKSNQLYYVVNESSNQIKLSQTLNGSFLGEFVTFNDNGGDLKIVSRVSDKNSGDIGHPIQWDPGVLNWYITVSSSNNEIYSKIRTSGIEILGQATPRTYIQRTPDTRNLIDTLYRFRYVIPKDSSIEARPPLDGYIIQDSSTSNAVTETDVQNYFSNSTVELISSTELRNPKFISDAVWGSGFVTITTELPHNLVVGTEIEISNINPSGYNGLFIVSEIINSRKFKYALADNPGAFSSNTTGTSRNQNLPTLKKKLFNKTYQIYRTEEIQPYISNEQDGIYYLIVINSSNSPTVFPFKDQKFSQPIQNLYPQTNRDNPISDPNASSSFSLPDPIGQVVIDNPQHSLTKETLHQTLQDFNVGFGITSISSDQTGTQHTIFSNIDHRLSGITSVTIVSGGANYVSGTYYATDVVGFAGSTTGSNASVKVIVNDNGSGIGTITSVEIMDGGSAYGIGNSLNVIPAAGIGTTTGFVPGVIEVTSVSNDIGDVLSISGIAGTYSNYNTLYRLTEITNEKVIQVESASAIIAPSTVPIDSSFTSNTIVVRTGKSLLISSFEYSPTLGIATVGFTTSHGLSVNNKIRLTGFDSSFFNKDVIVAKKNSLLEVVVNVGKGEENLLTTGTRYAYKNGYTSNAGNITSENENISGRLISSYDGVTSVLTEQLETTSTTNELKVKDALEIGLKVGDYLEVNNEIFRIKETVIGDTLSVFRSLFGTKRETHQVNAVVRRIRVHPIEFRRNSIIRASGHTFEYVGFGPGNYSTSLPERQDRILSPQEEIIAQSTKRNGGIVVFNALNSDGDFYTGNKKINSTTGQEEVFESPIPTVTGEEITLNTDNVGFDIISPIEATITRSLRVEGGPENNLTSEFDGPVLFNNKVTSYSDIETNSLLIQGEEKVSRRVSISPSKPSRVGSYGDINFNSNPSNGDNIGWVYATDNQWRPFGFITNNSFGVGVANNNNIVGFSTLIDFVGIGMTVRNEYDSTTGISTLFFEGDPVNTIELRSEGSVVGNASKLNFVGVDDGFGFNIAIDFDNSSGIATVAFDSPIDDINFGNGVLGFGFPTFNVKSPGTRIIYEQRLDSTNTNYSVGIGADGSLWWSTPNINGSVFRWFGGQSEIARLEGVSENNGRLYVSEIVSDENVTSGRFISTVTSGTSPISIASSTLVSNLNANFLNGFISEVTRTPNTIVRRDASNNINGNASHLIHNVSGAQRGEWYADIPARLGYTPFNRAGDTCTGNATFNGITTLRKVSDIFTSPVPTGTTLTCDFNNGPIARTTSNTIQNINIINVPTTSDRVLNYTVIINPTGTISDLANLSISINNQSLSNDDDSSNPNKIRWLNGIGPNGTSKRYYFFGLSIFRVGSNWEVIGVFANYQFTQ